MSNRKVYHVVPDKRNWKVKLENVVKESSSHAYKSDAVIHAKELAKSHSKGQVIIHKRDGTFQTEYTYGDDPFPPEG